LVGGIFSKACLLVDDDATKEILFYLEVIVVMSEIYEVYVKTHFSAAHALRGYPGDCARMHGHNWITEVYVKCKKLNDIGIGVDFRDIKNAVKDVLKGLDHFNLNELTAFQEQNPTSENIARYLYYEIGKLLNNEDVQVSKVRVCETPGAGAFFWEE
jgi:6-pyruvoyltetrahydropterin/6-carboxytetrahydropterin synthase